MRRTLLCLALSTALSTILLAACSPNATPPKAGSVATAPSTAAVEAATTDAKPASLPEPGEANGMPASDTPDGSDAQARFDGYGDVKLGIEAAAIQAAWGGELNQLGGPQDTCYFMTPKWVKAPAEFAFMIEDGKFVRYGTESTKFVAPGGGRVGMTMAAIQSLYPGRIETQPHKYTDGKYLRIKDAATGNALLFETDVAGKVTEWRVGMPPQVDYVEGCS
ncbi:MAG: lectin [Thermomonas sp.]